MNTNELDARIRKYAPELFGTAIYRERPDILEGADHFNLSMLNPEKARARWEGRPWLKEDLSIHYQGGRFLDVCCGVGPNIYCAVRDGLVRSGDVFGVDSKQAHIEAWKFHYSKVFEQESLQFPPPDQVRAGDALKLPLVFPGTTFRYVIANFCLENIRDRNAVAFAKSVARVTEKGGRLYLITFADTSPNVLRDNGRNIDGYSPKRLAEIFGEDFGLREGNIPPPREYINWEGETRIDVHFFANRR